MSHTIDLIFTTGIKFWFKTNIFDPHHRHHNHPHQHDNQVPSCNCAYLLLVLLHRIHGSSKMVGIDNYFNLDYLINTLCLISGSWWWTLWFTASCTPTMLSGPWGCPLQPQYWFCLLLYMIYAFVHFLSLVSLWRYRPPKAVAMLITSLQVSNQDKTIHFFLDLKYTIIYILWKLEKIFSLKIQLLQMVVGCTVNFLAYRYKTDGGRMKYIHSIDHWQDLMNTNNQKTKYQQSQN